MAKHFVTTMNKKLFDDYGKDLLISYMNTSQKYPIYVYVEDDIQKYPIMKNVIYVSLFKEEPECKKNRSYNKICLDVNYGSCVTPPCWHPVDKPRVCHHHLKPNNVPVSDFDKGTECAKDGEKYEG